MNFAQRWFAHIWFGGDKEGQGRVLVRSRRTGGNRRGKLPQRSVIGKDKSETFAVGRISNIKKSLNGQTGNRHR
jgi:hypothetical protein